MATFKEVFTAHQEQRDEWIQLSRYMKSKLGNNYTNWYRFLKNPTRGKYAIKLMRQGIITKEDYWLRLEPSRSHIWNNPLMVQVYRDYAYTPKDLASKIGVTTNTLLNIFKPHVKSRIADKALIQYAKSYLMIDDGETLLNASTELYSRLKLLKPKSFIGKQKLVSFDSNTRA